jgi:ATP-dependent Clp protease ATP-binding subunit ClpA
VIAYVVLHVRTAPDGSVVVTPADFRALALGAPDVERAIAELRPKLVDALDNLDAFDRASFFERQEAELVAVTVEVAVGGKDGAPVAVPVDVVVEPREIGGETVFFARVPVMPRLSVLATSRERALARTRKRAAAVLKGWRPLSLLAAQNPADSRLETIELDLDAPAVQGALEESDVPNVLAELGDDLTARAEAGMLGRIDRRDDLVDRVLETLAGPGRSSVLLVGGREVGKTTLLHEIAARLVAGDVPLPLRGRRLWRLPANELIAGARYTGMWQDRVRNLVVALRSTGAICVMDDPIPIIDAGRWSGSDNNASRLLRPYVESGDITIVCESTPEQVHAAHRKEPSFVDAFHRLDVSEPGIDEAREIAMLGAARLGGAVDVEVAPDAVDAAIELTRRYEPYRCFPGKAVRLLEDAVRERGEGAERLGREEVTAAFARRSGLPLALLSDEVPLDLAAVREHFESRVLGQPEAREAMVGLIGVLKAGLSDPGKPLGSFFFVGPTGVGKTELAKALAELLFGSRERVARFDLGEYASGDAVPRLIGSGWRSDEDGELVRAIREQPFSVVLLDEIEKAHWSVFDALLAVLGEGRLTGAGGDTSDFRNAIVLMTSNLGAAESGSPLGFGAGRDERDRLRRHYVDEAESFFRPEFFNRIDRVVVFDPLDEATVRQIARRELGRLLMREGVVRRRLLVEVDEDAIDALAAAGFHPRYGARPLQRELERAVIQPLAALIVEQRPGPGAIARICLRDGRVTVELAAVVEAPPGQPARQAQPASPDGTFAKAVRAAADLVARLESEEATPAVAQARAELSEEIERTHDPAFWDDADRARATLARIYRLELVLDGFDALRRRADGLAELARQAAARRQRARLREVWSALAEMEDDLAVRRLELAGAVAAGDGGEAIVRVVPLGDGADAWAAELLEMYCAWAGRTAREATRLDGGAIAARIDGPSTFDLLAGESGLHRRVLPDRSALLARVVVAPASGSAAVVEDDAGTVVRVYEEGRRRVVRDPRTGTRETHLNAVLGEGRIDAFLLAWLRAAQGSASG